MNKVFRGAQDLYVAEDDFYKIYNYLAEFDNLKNAYRGTKPDLELANKLQVLLEIRCQIMHTYQILSKAT